MRQKYIIIAIKIQKEGFFNSEIDLNKKALAKWQGLVFLLSTYLMMFFF